MFRSKRRRPPAPAPIRPVLEALEDRCLLSGDLLQTNLVSDIPGMANVTDPHLVNPWGLTSSPSSVFWVSDQGTGFSTLYNGQGQPQSLVVTIPTSPTAPAANHGTPTGTVFNTAGTGFNVSENGKTGSSIFLFDTVDGTISGWSPGVDRTNAIVAVSNPGSVYTGLAIGVDSKGDTLLYANNYSKGTIDVFDSNFKPVTTLAGNFQDPKIPAGFTPFNVQNLNGQLFVEYAKVDPTTGGVAPGRGNGFVDVFNTDGQLQQHLIGHGQLDNPFGVALAPSNFGKFSNDLLVGNFGNGRINAFDPTNGHFLGTLTTADGKPFDVEHLWAIRFGNGAGAGPANTLFFTAGLTSHFFGTSNLPPHGLFGSLQAIPEISPRADVVANLPNAAQQTVTTVPANGDQNPYGVAFVPQDIKPGGVLQAGDILVSNFNDKANVQGTGSTIVRITPDGQHSVFFQGGPGLGLTTALGVLKSGFVIVGNVPTDANGLAQPGPLIVLNSNGNQVATFSDPTNLDGPWDLAINDQGNRAQVFVSDVLSGKVTRLDLAIPKGGTPFVVSETVIASGYAHRTDPNALVVGPTGLAFDAAHDVLYVASTADNAIYAVHDAAFTHRSHGKGQLFVKDDAHLHGPLGLTLAPNGDLIVANGDAVNADPKQANEIVEFNRHGQFAGEFQLDPGAPGAAFGIALSTQGGQLRFAAVDDNTNTLHTFTFNVTQPTPRGGHEGRHEGPDEFFRLLGSDGFRDRHGDD